MFAGKIKQTKIRIQRLVAGLDDGEREILRLIKARASIGTVVQTRQKGDNELEFSEGWKG